MSKKQPSFPRSYWLRNQKKNIDWLKSITRGENLLVRGDICVGLSSRGSAKNERPPATSLRCACARGSIRDEVVHVHGVQEQCVEKCDLKLSRSPFLAFSSRSILNCTHYSSTFRNVSFCLWKTKTFPPYRFCFILIHTYPRT